jgi:hypothetical protein
VYLRRREPVSRVHTEANYLEVWAFREKSGRCQAVAQAGEQTHCLKELKASGLVCE